MTKTKKISAWSASMPAISSRELLIACFQLFHGVLITIKQTPTLRSFGFAVCRDELAPNGACHAPNKMESLNPAAAVLAGPKYFAGQIS
jgi:hypothetical protein